MKSKKFILIFLLVFAAQPWFSRDCLSAQLVHEVVRTIIVGQTPLDVAVNPITNMVYVTHANGDVTVVNGETNQVIKKIYVGGQVYSLAVNEATNRVYAPRRDNSGTLVVIDGDSNTLSSTIVLSGIKPYYVLPVGVALNPNTNKIYVSNLNRLSMWVIDGNTDTEIGTVALTGGGNPQFLALNPNTNRIYITKFNPPLPFPISVVDGVSNAEIAHIPVGSRTAGIAVDPLTNTIYATNDFESLPGEGIVFVIDGYTNSVLTTIGVGIGPQRVAINSNLGFVYVTNAVSNSVSVIDALTNSVVDTIDNLHYFPNGVAVNPLTNRIYVARKGSNVITVIDVRPIGVIDLIDDTRSIGLQQNLEQQLLAKLDKAADILNDANSDNDIAAIGLIEAFINSIQAHRGKSISESDADQLIDTALNVIEAIENDTS